MGTTHFGVDQLTSGRLQSAFMRPTGACLQRDLHNVLSPPHLTLIRFYPATGASAFIWQQPHRHHHDPGTPISITCPRFMYAWYASRSVSTTLPISCVFFTSSGTRFGLCRCTPRGGSAASWITAMPSDA